MERDGTGWNRMERDGMGWCDRTEWNGMEQNGMGQNMMITEISRTILFLESLITNCSGMANERVISVINGRDQ